MFIISTEYGQSVLWLIDEKTWMTEKWQMSMLGERGLFQLQLRNMYVR